MLIYPYGRTPRLAPDYDVVPTHLSIRHFRRIVQETVQRMLEVWPRINADLPIDEATRSLVTKMMQTTPVFTGAKAAAPRDLALAGRAARHAEVE